MRVLVFFGALLLGVAWLLPGHYFPWLTFQQEFAALLGAALIAGPAWLPRAAKVQWPWLSLTVLAAAGVPLLQLAFGQIRFVSDALVSSGYLAATGISIAAGATLVRRNGGELVGSMFIALVAAAFLSTGMALMEWQDVGIGLWVEAARPGGRLTANLAQPNHFATALAIGISGLLLAYERRRVGGVGTTIGIAFLGFGMVMSQSRTGWLFVAVLGLWLLLMRRRASLRVSPLAVMVGLALFVAAIAAWAPLNDAMLLARQVSPADLVAKRGLRLIHWQVMLDAAWRKPWFGYGWTQAVLGQEAAVLDHPFTGEVLNSSHNVLMDLLIWNGIPLGALFIAGLGWWFARQLVICRTAERVCLVAALGAIFLHGLLEYPLEYAYFLMPAGLLMGTLDGLAPAAPSVELPRVAMAIPSLVLCTLLAWVGAEYVKVDEAGRVMRFVAMGIGLDRVADAPEPEVTLLDRPRNLHRFMLMPAHRSADPGYLDWVRDVATRNPMAPAMLRHALAAGLNGHAQEARNVLARLCRMHSAEHCLEGKSSWIQLQKIHPELRDIAPPELPAGSVPVPHGELAARDSN